MGAEGLSQNPVFGSCGPVVHFCGQDGARNWGIPGPKFQRNQPVDQEAEEAELQSREKSQIKNLKQGPSSNGAASE